MRLVSGVSATAAITAAALAGCSSGGSGTTSASGSSTPSAAASATASTTTAGASPVASTRCTTKDLSLRVIQGPQEEASSTGSFYVQLSNTSARTCTLYGFPGVELLGGVGGTPKPLGMKDVWTVKLSMTGNKKTQTLKPSTASAAYVNFSTRDPGASAGIPRAIEVQVIPPDQTTALTARIYNVDSGYVTPLVTTKTLTVGPMDVDGVPHK
jgi:hypothetical protein